MGVLRGRSFLAAHYHATTIAPSAMMSAQNAATHQAGDRHRLLHQSCGRRLSARRAGDAGAAGSLLPRMPQQQLRSLFVTPL